jgi:hypothetical protein
MLVGQKPRPSLVDPFKLYLVRRIGEGCLKAIRSAVELVPRRPQQARRIASAI